MPDVRLIDANALEALFLRFHQETDLLDADWFTPYLFVKDAETIDAVPVVHGRWIDCENYNDIRQCSECGLIRNIYKQEGWNYCPNCGAKMDAKEADHG